MIITLTLTLILLMLTARFGGAGLRRLAELPLGGMWLPPIAVAAQLAVVTRPELRLLALGVTIVVIAAFCLTNRRLGFLLAGNGAMLNLLVMAANGGLMPVQPELVSQAHGVTLDVGQAIPFTKNITLADSQAALALLGDRFLLPGPLQHLAIWSLGDMLLIVGVTATLYHAMRGPIHAEVRTATLHKVS